MLEKYEKLSKIGSGAQGKVFHVRHRTTGEEYALKIIRCKDPVQANFALKEIKVLIQLRHPNIVHYSDFFLDFDNRRPKEILVCLVMELCQSGDLQGKIKEALNEFMTNGKNKTTEQQVVQWMLQGARALKYIHDRGFLHRDMKPTNIFFSSNNEVKLGDFGLATTLGAEPLQSTVGTPLYFAPEILLQKEYNHSVDIWGLGVVILELLTLEERPINSEVLECPEKANTVISHIQRMGYSKSLAVLVRDMLKKSPYDRPTSDNVISRLEAIASNVNGTSASFSILTQPLTSRPSVQTSFAFCDMCQSIPPVVICPKCEESYCIDCDIAQHRAASRKDHQRALVTQPSTPTENSVDEGPSAFTFTPICQMCEDKQSVVQCPSCDFEYYCAECDRMKHTNPRRRRHERSQVTSLAECYSNDIPRSLSTDCSGANDDEIIRTWRLPSAKTLHSTVPEKRHPLREITTHVNQYGALNNGCLSMPMTITVPSQMTIYEAIAAITAAEHASGTDQNSQESKSSDSPLVHTVLLDDDIVIDTTLTVECCVQITSKDEAGKTICVRLKTSNAELTIPPPGIILKGASGTLSNLKLMHCVDSDDNNKASASSVSDQQQHARTAAIVVSSGQWVIEKCRITSEISHGIIVERAFISVNSSAILQTKQTGIYLATESSYGVIENNHIIGAGQTGILLKEVHSNTIIKGNRIQQGAETGVYLFNCPNVVVGKNHIFSNGGSGLVVKGPTCSPTVETNRITENNQAGIYVCDGARGRITDNTITANRKSGILVKAGANPSVLRNTVQQGHEAGIYVLDNGTGTFEHNQVIENANAGILITTGGRPTMAYNVVRGNRFEGLWVCKKGGGVYKNNDLRGNRKGPKDVEEGSAVLMIGNIETDRNK